MLNVRKPKDFHFKVDGRLATEKAVKAIAAPTGPKAAAQPLRRQEYYKTRARKIVRALACTLRKKPRTPTVYHAQNCRVGLFASLYSTNALSS